MQLLLGPRPLQQPFSDAALMLAVRKGQVEFFRLLYRRHYPAVQAYASQCMAGPLRAQEVTSRVFAQLLQQMEAGEAFVERRHAGFLRLQLLGMVRTTAIASWHREPEALLPDFQAWVAQGAQWPWGEDGQLGVAFERLPSRTQRLLWHSVVEQDAPTLTARITGLAPRTVRSASDEARSALREACTELYLERLELPDCRDTIKRLSMRPDAPPAAQSAAHLRACAACMSVYKDIAQLDSQLEGQLPARLLGWWTGQQYLRAKAAIPMPLGDPPFLARLLGQSPTHASTDRTRTRRATTRTGPAGGRSRRRSSRLLSPATAAVTGFLLGIGTGLLLLTASHQTDGPQTKPPTRQSPPPTPPPTLSARNGIQADQYTSQQDTAVGSTPGSRRLGSSSLLRYDRVRFSAKDSTAQVRLSGPPDSGAWIELRTDSLAQAPLAQIEPGADGFVADVSVPIAPVDGVHPVYVVAHCPTNTTIRRDDLQTQERGGADDQCPQELPGCGDEVRQTRLRLLRHRHRCLDPTLAPVVTHRRDLVVPLRPVKQLPHDVRVPRVPSGLLDEMDEHPAEAGVAGPAVGVAADVIQRGRGHDLVASSALGLVRRTRGRECAPSLRGNRMRTTGRRFRPGCSRRRRRVRRR